MDGKRVLRFIQPVECWSFRTQIYLSFTVTDLIVSCQKSLRSSYLAYNLAGSFRVQNFNIHSAYTLVGERGGSVVECRTPEREVRGSRPTAAVLCP